MGARCTERIVSENSAGLSLKCVTRSPCWRVCVCVCVCIGSVELWAQTACVLVKKYLECVYRK